MSSATEASKKRWNSISCFGPRGTSSATPLTVSVTAAAPFGSSLADHQGPLRSSRVNAERGDLDFFHRVAQLGQVRVSSRKNERFRAQRLCSRRNLHLKAAIRIEQ